MVRSSLTGREPHTRLLAEAMSDARNGRSRVITITGVAGSGKTALLEAAATASREAFRVLRISGHPAEEDLPFAGVHQLTHQGGSSALVPVARDSDPLRDATALLEALTALACDTPVLLLIDDAQWIDHQSLRALVFIARRLAADPVCVLFGVRTPRTERLVVGTELEVGPLSAEESLNMLRAEHPLMSARVAAKLVDAAHGLPLALHEIPLDLTAAQRCGTAPLPPELPLGRTLTQRFAERIDPLPDATRAALIAASFDALDSRAYAAVLSSLGIGIPDLDAAERAGLVRVRDGTCDFTHPLAPAALRSGARAQELIAVHRALARHFAHDPVRYAAHLRHDAGLSVPQLRSALHQGAEAAAEARNFHQAADLWSAAADSETDPAKRRDMLQNAVHCLVQAGSGPEAQTLIRQLLAEPVEAAEHARVLRDLTSVSLWTRLVEPEDDAMVEGRSVELLSDADPESHRLGRDLLTALAAARLGAGEYRRAHRASHLLTVRAGGRLTLEQELLCDVIAVMVGAPGAGALLRSGDTWVDAYPWRHILDPGSSAGLITAVLGWLGEYRTHDRVLTHCQRVADGNAESISARYIAGSMAAARERHRGHWEESRRELETLELLSESTDFAGPYPFIALRHAHLLAARGDREACEQLRMRARTRAPVWTPSMAHLDHAVAGLLACTLRDYRTALEHLDKAARIEEEVGLVSSGYLSRAADAFEAAWRLGEGPSRPGAPRLTALAAFESAMHAVGHRAMLGLAARCRALVAPLEDMDAKFTRSVELLAAEPDGFESARTHLVWGERLRRARRKADAREKLTLAHATFTRLGALAWVERCSAELAACGVRRAHPHGASDGPTAQLTPREFEVVEVVARGSTNAETAQQLFISERTVEFHLYNAFRKLGVDTREALTAILAE